MLQTWSYRRPSAVPVRNRLLLGIALLAGATLPVAGTSPACAGEGARAALVVDTSENTYRYCVTLPDDSVSGIGLIELANDQYGLQYRLGSGGQAVCMLANVGAEGDDCFGKYPDFWGYWRGDGHGGWDWSSAGAGSTVVVDGDVEGWSWGSGQDGASHPSPPETTFDSVCKPLPPPKEKDKERPTAGRSETKSAIGTELQTAAPEDRKAGRRAEEPPQESDDAQHRLTPRAATEFDDPSGAAAAAPGDDVDLVPDQGPPITGVVALALVGALGAAGAIAMKRRQH